jgi:hypothetical protein
LLEDIRHVQLHHQGTDIGAAGMRRVESHESLPIYAEGMGEAIFEGCQCEDRSKHRENLVYVEVSSPKYKAES